MLDRGEVLLEQLQQLGIRPACQHLGDKGSARREVLDCEPRCRFDETHGAQVIGLLVADGIGGHVGHHQIGRTAQGIGEHLRRGIGHEIHLEDRHALKRFDRQQVDPHHLRFGRFGARHLAPAAGRNAEIDHAGSALQQAEFLVELDQLVGRAAAIAIGLGLPDVRIVELAFEPAHLARGAALGGLDPLARILAAAGHRPTLSERCW